MSMSKQKNIGAYLSAGRAFVNTAVTAAGSGDATEITGTTIDLAGAGDGGHVKSAMLLIPYGATLADTESFTFAVNIQESADGSTWDTAEVIAAAATIATAAGAAQTASGCSKYAVDLSGRKRYLRSMVTPNMSASATDAMTLSGAWAFYGDNVVPASPVDLTNVLLTDT